MSNDGDYVERTTTEAPASVRRDEVHVVRSNNSGWWIALAIAIVAVIGLFFWMSNQNSDADLQAARDEGAAQAQLANAAANAQSAANQAAQSAQSAVTSTARATENAAQSAADRTANAADAARDAAATEPSEPPPPR